MKHWKKFLAVAALGLGACGGPDAAPDLSTLQGPSPGRVEVVEEADGTATIRLNNPNAAGRRVSVDFSRSAPSGSLSCASSVSGCFLLDANGRATLVDQVSGNAPCAGNWTFNAATVHANADLTCAAAQLADCADPGAQSWTVAGPNQVNLQCFAPQAAAVTVDVDCADGC